MYQIMDSNNNIRQHHVNNVDPVLMSTQYASTMLATLYLLTGIHS